MSFEDIRSEYEASLIGDEIYALVKKLVTQALRSRDPRVYGQGSHDYRDAIDDVCQAFILEDLIAQRQLDYVFLTAVDIKGLERFITFRLGRFLARTRERTVIDNLIDRSLEMLEQSPFQRVGIQGDEETYGLAGENHLTGTPPTKDLLRTAVTLARSIPTDKSSASERAPRIYSRDALQDVLGVLLTTVRAPITRKDLQTFFEQLLTAWIPGFLESDEELHTQEGGYSPEEEVIIEQTVDRLLSEMDGRERLVFAYWHAHLPDRAAAAQLGLSRQTIVSLRSSLTSRIRPELEDLDAQLQSGLLAELAARLAHLSYGVHG
jgi:hypothetical protein